MANDGAVAGRQEEAEDVVDAAFAEVIAAEAAAEAAVLACRNDAEQRLAAAHTASAALSERSRQKYDDWCCRQAAGQALALAAFAEAARAAEAAVALDADALRRLERAVERLADELCGGDPG